MASLLSPRRSDTEVSLQATSASGGVPRPGDPDLQPGKAGTPPWRPGWPLAAVLAGGAAAGGSWLLCAGLAVVGWLVGNLGDLPGALGIGSRLWLLANGVPARLGTLPVTLVPWGLTALVAVSLSRLAALVARHARTDPPPRPLALAGVLTGAYLVPVLLLALAGAPSPLPVRSAVVAAVLLAAATRSAAHALGVSPVRRWPQWARGLPTGLLGVQLVLLVAGAALLAASLVVHLGRVTALTAALRPGPVGGAVLVLAQLAFVPSACVWSASYALGAGFAVGPGSLVAPAGSELGVLPGVPLLGALPGPGPGGTGQLWWLVAGALAGAVGAWLTVRARPPARPDHTSLAGGLVGLLGGVVFTGLAWAASGDVGSLRLAGLGPRLLPLLVLGATTVGLAGMVTGAALGFLRRPHS